MFAAIARAVSRWPKTVLVVSLVGLVGAAVVGGGVFDRLSSGGFEDPDAESTRAVEVLAERFGTGPANLVFVATAVDGDVDTAAAVAEGTALTETLAGREDLADVVGYWSFGGLDALRSEDGSRALIVARALGDDDERQEVADALAEEIPGDRGVLQVEMSGEEVVFGQVGETIEGDLARAESVAVPITLLLLIAVFGGIIVALLPVAVGLVAVLGAFLVLWLVTGFTDVSVFSINLVTAMGLGLAIDYSLFIVSRFREELAGGHGVTAATRRTIMTAGRTVAFSALTVGVSLSALLIFPLYFLKSFAYAGIGVIIVAMVASVITLPALLQVLGHRVDALTIWRRHPAPVGTGVWHRIATTVMARPIPIAVGVTALLLVLGLPFLRVQFGVPDEKVLPEGNAARVTLETVAAEFGSDDANGFPIVAPDASDPLAIGDYAAAVSAVEGVGRVDAATGTYVDGAAVAEPDLVSLRFSGEDATWFNVVPDVEPISVEAETMVDEIRSIDGEFDVLVGGRSAGLVDSKDAIFDLVPWAGLLIALSTFVLLFLAFGSVLVPIKAIILNLLSLTATFGMMVWVFQDGNGAGLLGFTATGLTDTTTPILMFCIAFGLSMDYEVFLISRIREEYDRSGDNDAAVAIGLERTGRIVTAAALLLSVTFLAFATSGITFIKLFGLGLAIAVLVDATIVRATLVPALMKLAGNANWWAPSFLTGLYRRAGLSESAAEAAADAVAPVDAAVAVDPPVSVDLVPAIEDPELSEGPGAGERAPAVVRR